MVEHLLERRRRVVVKMRGGSADAAKFVDVHHPDGRWLIWTQLDQVGHDIMLMENFR